MTVVSILFGVVLTAAAPLLVSTDQVGGLKDAIIADARSNGDFVAGHLPGAISLPADALSEKRGEVHGLLKPLDQLNQLVGDAGADPKKHIVVYSDMADPEKRVKATRLFWILQYMGFPRVSLLDGGIGKWKSEGRELATGEVAVEKVTIGGLEAKAELLVVHSDVSEMLSGKTGVVMDMRPQSFFTGCKFKDYVAREGHISGARNLAEGDLLTGPDYVFKDPEEIQALLGQKGVEKDTRLITYCNSGQSATVGYFGALLAGKNTVAVYDGSMAEWSRLADAPVSCKPDLP